MSTTSSNPDDQLLSTLGSVLDQIEAPSPSAVDAATQLIILRSLDGALFGLVADSAEHAVAHRADRTARLLTFEAGDHRLEIDAHLGEGMTTGQLTPAGVSEITMVTGAGSTTVTSDEHGRFRSALGVLGPRRWQVRFSDGAVVVTPIIRM